jgi:D-proline reductase (dithiol) PrdB
MVRLQNLSEDERKFLLGLHCPTFPTSPWVSGPPLHERRLAVLTTSGLHLRTDRPFRFDTNECLYRVIPGSVQANDLVMSHISASFDRTGFQRDWNVVFPLDRLREMKAEDTIGSLADFHYSMVTTRDPLDMVEPAQEIARLLKKDNVNAVLLLPV